MIVVGRWPAGCGRTAWHFKANGEQARGLMLVLICVNANPDVEDSVSSSGYSQGAWQ
ncbi:MAG: hypothetical protein IPN24_04365 [Betaproteobacteria bacterium]|nr:hypothetical protein [Betaproteobacteria bacterium]